MFDVQLETLPLVITGGSVAFALGVLLWSVQFTAGARATQNSWREKTDDLERKLARSDAIFSAHPGVILVWDNDAEAPADDAGLEIEDAGEAFAEADDDDDEETGKSRRGDAHLYDWGAPKVFGSPPALAVFFKWTEGGVRRDAGSAILDGLADWDAIDGAGEKTTLRKSLEALRERGEPFSLTLDTPRGGRIDADGRPAGGRVVLWLADSTIKGVEVTRSSDALRGEAVGADPLAFVDVLDKAPFPMFRLSSSGKLQSANTAYATLVGARNVQDAIGRDLQIDKETREQARKAVAHGARVDERRAVVAGGERRHYAISTFPISGGVGGVAIDVTREQDARDALERHVRAQDDALNHLRDAVAIFGPDQTLVFHNRAFRVLFDLDEAWLNQRPAHGALLDRLRERRMIPEQADYQAWRAGELASYASADGEGPEEEWTLPDGRLLRVARLRHPLGGLLLIFDDMTREMTLEAGYTQQIRVHRATLDKLSEGVVVFGMDGRLRLHNAAFETMWGLKAGQLREGASFDEVVAACLPLFSDHEEWAEIKARITDAGHESRQAILCEIRRSDNTILTYSQRPLPDSSTVISFHDVTAAKRLQDALKDRNDALVATDRMKSRLVENVSYHLRAPLTSVIGFAELLEATILGKLTEGEASHLAAILEAGSTLNRLVEDIIDVAAIEAGTIEIDPAEMPVEPVLESACTLVKTRAQETKVRLSIACAPDVGSIRADQRRIKQVIYYLLLNSLDHTLEGGSIEVGAATEGSGVRIWVEDDGEGIPIEQQGKVFDAFQSGAHGGAGLGLTLVREFVELHGGWVDIESMPNVGTCVTCHLLKAPPDETRGKAPERQSEK
ncbi:MAG: PAS-domain containing protein [Maricaulaceae bacterium]|jgi:signal transduction histidine kinase